MSKQIERSILWSLLGNFFLAIVKWCVGYFGNSYALIADAIESTTDIFSSFIVWLGIKYSNKPADDNHPYGHGRIEPLVTFLVVTFLFSSAILIIYQSIKNIQTPHQVPETYTLYFLIGIILIKEFFYYRLKQKSKETNSSTLKAEAWHHRSDSISSFAALIGVFIAIIFGNGFEIADDIAAIVAAILIIYNAYLIFRPAFGEMMDEQLHDELIFEIRTIASKHHQVEGTEKCYVRKIGLSFWIDLHLLVNGNLTVHQGHQIAHQVKDDIQSQIKNIKEVLIHVEPYLLKN